MIARLLGLACAFVAVFGCSPTLEIQTVSRPGWRTPAVVVPDCSIPVHPPSKPLEPGCREVGDVFVGDTGWSTDCGRRRVAETIRVEGCRYGADAAQIVSHHEPSFFGSTCHQVRARFLACDVEAPDAR